ncbi:hypothetical protein SAMN05216412_11326 [Nitrosospira multiformis]|uniref:Uncharacterized protein n=2 Tax=Nitrosospira multiformis TaxID=1231 RepID=A0A1I0GFY3_9PROT|nr:hypothetical protein SAMN05216412_11326 [Nitrosospira multiformis]
MPPLWYGIAALCISTLALFIAIKNYRRKAGLLIRGGFSIASGIDCNDKYVSNVLLENLKDRPVTVFSIYLRIGHNYYLEVENFEETPLLLRAYETYQKEYGPIQFYGINFNRMNLSSLLDDDSVKKRLVLSTSDGKYIIPSGIPRWNPISDFFRNHMTAVVRPVHITYNGKYVGENIKYVIEICGENEETEVLLIHPNDFNIKKFRNFSLTRESLESVALLNDHLEEQIRNGRLICKSFKVHDVNEWRQRVTEFYTAQTIDARYYGLLRYHIVGRLLTLYSDRKLKAENAKRRFRIRPVASTALTPNDTDE